MEKVGSPASEVSTLLMRVGEGVATPDLMVGKEGNHQAAALRRSVASLFARASA
jgi:hypothetical protein